MCALGAQPILLFLIGEDEINDTILKADYAVESISNFRSALTFSQSLKIQIG